MSETPATKLDELLAAQVAARAANRGNCPSCGAAWDRLHTDACPVAAAIRARLPVIPIPTSYAIAAQQITEAQESLYDNTDDLPCWPWPDITSLCGKPLPGDLTVIGARPANGKSTFMLNLFDHLVTAGFPTLYIGAGSEGPPKDTRKQWAALRLGFPVDRVMENRWGELPEGARDHLFDEIQRQGAEHDVAHFADAGERLTPGVLGRAVDAFATCPAARYVLLDHIHRLRFGADKNPRLELAEATRWLRDRAARYAFSIIVAAQLHRAPSQHGALRDLIPPSLNDLKETGTLEEDAVVVLLLHRVKRATVDQGDLAAVNRGERPISDILEPNCMAVRVGKHRRRGRVMDETAFLEVAETGRLNSRLPVWRTVPGFPSQPEKRYGV